MGRRVLAFVLLAAGCASRADDPSVTATPNVTGQTPPPSGAPGSAPSASTPASRPDLVLLDFNVAINGLRDIDGIIAVLRKTAPDVAVLQECDAACAGAITTKLGWQAVTDSRRLLAIVGPNPTTSLGTSPGAGRWGGVGATVDLGARGRVHVFDIHLDWQKYGPYLIAAGVENDDVVANERRVRTHDLDAMLKMMEPQLASGEPTFLAGDFNAPSHLDYDNLPWPTSMTLYERGLLDTYRTVNVRKLAEHPPYEPTSPGVTWSPLLGAESIAFDRIDFTYFKGKVRPVSSVTLDARNGVDPWPSDHRAVLSGFALR